MRASPSLSQLWQPHSRLCQLCRGCEQQRSCSPGFCRKELHATEGAVEVRRARRRLEEAVPGGHNSPTAQTFTLPHPQRLVQDLSCLSWTCLAFLLAFMSLRLTTLSLPSMLAFAALHCLARASSLPMASFMASPHAEFVLTEPASAESDACPHVTVFYGKSALTSQISPSTRSRSSTRLTRPSRRALHRPLARPTLLRSPTAASASTCRRRTVAPPAIRSSSRPRSPRLRGRLHAPVHRLAPR